MELLVLNAELRELRPNFYMTAAVSPWLESTGDPSAYIIRMQKQIVLLWDLLQNSKRKDEEKASGSPAQIQVHAAQLVHNVASTSQPVTGRKGHFTWIAASRQVRHHSWCNFEATFVWTVQGITESV